MFLLGVPMDITEQQLGIFFSKFGQIEDISTASSKIGIAIGDYMLEITMTRENFMAIPDILSCWECNILVIVKGHCPHSWSCGVVGHLSKTCPGRNPPMNPTTAVPKPAALKETMEVEKSGQTASGSSDWKEVVRRGGKNY